MAGGQRIAITGMAWLTALGDDLEPVWQALLAGKSGMRPVAYNGRLRNLLAAPAMDERIPASERLVRMACATIRKALASANREPGDSDVRYVLSTSLGAYLDEEASCNPLSGWARDVARELGSAKLPVVISTACSSGACQPQAGKARQAARRMAGQAPESRTAAVPRFHPSGLSQRPGVGKCGSLQARRTPTATSRTEHERRVRPHSGRDTGRCS